MKKTYQEKVAAQYMFGKWFSSSQDSPAVRFMPAGKNEEMVMLAGRTMTPEPGAQEFTVYNSPEVSWQLPNQIYEFINELVLPHTWDSCKTVAKTHGVSASMLETWLSAGVLLRLPVWADEETFCRTYSKLSLTLYPNLNIQHHIDRTVTINSEDEKDMLPIGKTMWAVLQVCAEGYSIPAAVSRVTGEHNLEFQDAITQFAAEFRFVTGCKVAHLSTAQKS